ncbi:hypothetical protein GLS40_05500 [Pseudooceanicola sp. 216_PA32_1]|uniref:Uncharacterized protein n=1 Tax=Pseudooceanicola pacificus TaxID=2676438 RepID=A0A844W9E2_9RHOB|nr:hypothetical protein [Pseudooceanicola pacificus]MWB77473.1 hypothetical protein [Pseudooceanicola pacificus]
MRDHIAPRGLVAGLLLSALLAGGAAAEGARLMLDCAFVTSCLGGGACEAAEGAVRFAIAPMETDAEGAGDYTVIVDRGQAMPARALSRIGPFSWSPGPGRLHALSLTGEDSALWLRQITDSGTGAPPSAEIEILHCEVTQ